jgi:hypothetical protein
MDGLNLDDVKEQVRRFPTRCVSSKKKITIVLGLKSRVVTVGIKAFGLDPEDR